MTPVMNKAEAAGLLAKLLAGKMPDEHGRFGPYGGRYIPETLVPAFDRLTDAVHSILPTKDFQDELAGELRDWVGRPTALSPMRNLSRRWGAEVWFKREDLAHTGAHKINNALGQALMARRMGARRVVRRMGARRVVAETGAGQHGRGDGRCPARASVLPCVVYMGEVDMERQAPNVGRMRLMGATVVAGDQR